MLAFWFPWSFIQSPFLALPFLSCVFLYSMRVQVCVHAYLHILPQCFSCFQAMRSLLKTYLLIKVNQKRKIVFTMTKWIRKKNKDECSWLQLKKRGKKRMQNRKAYHWVPDCEHRERLGSQTCFSSLPLTQLSQLHNVPSDGCILCN